MEYFCDVCGKRILGKKLAIQHSRGTGHAVKTVEPLLG